MTDIKKQLIKLGSKHPHLRDNIKPVLRALEASDNYSRIEYIDNDPELVAFDAELRQREKEYASIVRKYSLDIDEAPPKYLRESSDLVNKLIALKEKGQDLLKQKQDLSTSDKRNWKSNVTGANAILRQHLIWEYTGTIKRKAMRRVTLLMKEEAIIKREKKKSNAVIKATRKR